MANIDTKMVKKLAVHRGVYGGREQSVTAVLPLAAGTVLTGADTIRTMILGENVRPLRVILAWTPTEGTPVLTAANFNVGVATYKSETFTRMDGTTYEPLTTASFILSPSLALDGDNMRQDVQIARPVADSVSKYAPFYVTLTPAGVDFTVAGGAGELALTVIYTGEQDADGFIYDEYINPKVAN